MSDEGAVGGSEGGRGGDDVITGATESARTAVLDSRSVSKRGYEYTVEAVNADFQRLLSKQKERRTLTDLVTTTVRPGYNPPSSYEGRCCVYVLVLQRASMPDSVYVGETESIRQRLAQHRWVHGSLAS